MESSFKHSKTFSALSCFFFFFFFFFFIACHTNQSLKEKQSDLSVGNIDSTYKYTCAEIGWQTMLPKDWDMLTKDQMNDMNAKGKDLLEKSTGQSIDMSDLKELVNMRKDKFNSFLSTIERYDSTLFTSVAEYNDYVDKLIENAYKSKKIKFDDKTDSEMIGGIMFHTIEIHLYASGSNDIILTQRMYNAVLHGYGFSMTANYNNDEDKQTLMNVVKGSTFR